MKNRILTTFIAALTTSNCVIAKNSTSTNHYQVADHVITQQRAALAKSTGGKGYGPQSPRDISSAIGNNITIFSAAPAFDQMNLCNIHFHKNAEHKGGQFTQHAGNGNGYGYQSGYKYDGHLNKSELKPIKTKICGSKHGSLVPGDTIEVHYIHSTAQVKPGPTLASCLSESTANPQLRVEAQVYVLVNKKEALNFVELTKHDFKSGRHQALNIPNNTGTPIQYLGSTTGPSYNESGSPFHVTWNVRPNVAKVDIKSVDEWCKSNVYNEDHAHGVRNLVVNPGLLSHIK